MPLELAALDVAARDPDRLARFWAGLLDRPVADVPRYGAEVLPTEDPGFALRFVASDLPRTGLGRMHLHVAGTEERSQASTVARALDLGATPLDVGQRPEERHVVLADPEGNELCVIPEDNAFLAGTGRLGELAADGLREVGLFWRDALGWPLVWDEDGETAVQHPGGGAKLSWGGPPVREKATRNRLVPVLVPGGATGVDDEVRRLVGLGATALGPGPVDGAVELAGPGGDELVVLPPA